MTLSVKERLLLGNILPKEGNIANLRIVRKLRESMSFSEAEWIKFGFKEEGDQLKWDPTLPQDIEVEMGPTAQKMVQDTLKKLSTENKLTEDFLSLYDKFCPEGEV